MSTLKVKMLHDATCQFFMFNIKIYKAEFATSDFSLWVELLGTANRNQVIEIM